MRRDVLNVDKVPPEVKQALRALAMARYGVPNASMLVRELINKELIDRGLVINSSISDNDIIDVSNKNIIAAEDTIRVEVRLPSQLNDALIIYSESNFSTRQQVILKAVLNILGKDILLTNSIEVLRESNYGLSKIGNNLNQLAKALNTIAKFGGDKDVPELGKKLAAYRKDISKHIQKVNPVLQNNISLLPKIIKKRNKSRGK
jgi:hypothetical protein